MYLPIHLARFALSERGLADLGGQAPRARLAVMGRLVGNLEWVTAPRAGGPA